MTNNVRDLLKTIPPCIRCRRNHRGCDVLLPKCNNCVKAGLDECLYYDNILDKNVSRGYLASLATRVADLQALHDSVEDTAMNDITTPATDAGSGTAFFGPYSCPAEVLDQPLPNSSPSHDNDDLLSQLQADQDLSLETRRLLTQRYFPAVHRLYPILDSSHPILSNPSWQLNNDASNIFTFNIVLAISCRAVPQAYRHAGSISSIAHRAYLTAMEHVEEATGDVSVSSLRHMALLSLHALFAPDCGNLNQLVGVAIRLCVDMNIQKKKDPSLRRLLLSVLCIERQAGLCFDRPWSLLAPETDPYDETEPIEVLWGLLSVACNFRQSLYDNITLPIATLQASLQPFSDLIASIDPPLPNLVAEYHTVQLLLAIDGQCAEETCLTHAMALLGCYQQAQCFHTFLTGHWVFRACQTLLKRSPNRSQARSSAPYQDALMFLDRDSVIWSSYGSLLEVLKNSTP